MVITAATNSDFQYLQSQNCFFFAIPLSNMFDVFPLTQNEVSPVIFHATIKLVMMAYYF